MTIGTIKTYGGDIGLSDNEGERQQDSTLNCLFKSMKVDLSRLLF